MKFSLSFLSVLLISQSAFAGLPIAELAQQYRAIRAEATELAGAPLDMPRRAMVMYDIYSDSYGNYRFPLVALHGALWGYRFFEVTGPIGDAISVRYFYDRSLREEKKAKLRAFAEAFQRTNRSVFIDTYSNYYFTKYYGNEAGADQFVKAELLKALNSVHATVRAKRFLSDAEAKKVFQTALYFEQELTVGPQVRKATEDFNCPVLTFFALKPVVHFAYFPRGRNFWFHDFSDQKERIKRAVDAYDIAQSVGWTKVISSMKKYDLLPQAFFDHPRDYVEVLKERILNH